MDYDHPQVILMLPGSPELVINRAFTVYNLHCSVDPRSDRPRESPELSSANALLGWDP